MSQSFAQQLRTAYIRFRNSQVRQKTSEHDLRGRFIDHVIKKGLGYDEKRVLNETDKTDIWLLDSAVNTKKGVAIPAVVIETKDFHLVNNAQLSDPANIAHAFKYVHPGATRYVGLTNFKRFILWSVQASTSPQSLNKAIADVDLEVQSEYAIFGQSDVTRLAVISADEISRIYDDFKTSMGIDLTDPNNFDYFTAIVKNKILDLELIPQFNRLCQNLAKQHDEYTGEKSRLEQERNLLQRRDESAISLANAEGQIRNLATTFKPSIDFSDNYARWEKEVYPPGDETSSEDKQVRFANETAYTLLSRMLLIRIAEDKRILFPHLSDGELAERVRTVKALNQAYKMVLQFAFADAQAAIYKGFFQKDVFDWYWDGDGELNDSVKKALWHLNQYNFAGIQRDVFKYIYQHHMDKDERKKIGEYYTPDEVVRYILNAVGYVSDRDLRQLRLLDPGCGSGTFLVEAVGRLKKQGFGLTAEEIIRMTTGSSGTILGFDVNPFAVYLTESNLLFQLIDFVQQTGQSIEKFQVYRSDSLEPPSGQLYRGEADAVKSQKFDFVVGNPPYVRTRRLAIDERDALANRLKQKFPDILTGKQALGTANLDLYIVFTAFGIDWLSRNVSQPGRLGFIETGKFLTGENGTWLRTLILERCAVEEIVDLTRVKNVFKTQDVYPIILILRYEPDPIKRRSNSVKVKVVLKNAIDLLNTVQAVTCNEPPNYNESQEYLAYVIPQEQFEDHPDKGFEIYLSAPLKKILAKIAPKNHVTLEQVLSIDRGAERGGAEKWKDRLRKLGLAEYGNNFIVKTAEAALLSQTERSFLKNFVDGDTVAAFVPEQRGEYLCYDPSVMSNPKNSSLFETSPKIILPRRAQFLFACLDLNRNYALDDTYVGTIKKEAPLKLSYNYILGLLNSRTLDFYHKMHYMTRLQEDWFDYYDYTLSSLPVKIADPQLEREIEGLVTKLIEKTGAYHTAKRRLSFARELIAASGVSTTKSVGLSRLVRNKGGVGRRLETIRRKRNRIEFNRKDSDTVASYVEMVSEAAAAMLVELLEEKRKNFHGQIIATVLESIEFPADIDSLHSIDEHRKMLLEKIEELQTKIEMMREELDWKVAQAYGLSESEHQMMIRALKLVTLTQGLESKSRSDANIGLGT